ncbi:NFACT RNA binding domain-containing protein [Larkinella sp. VNQ87]|uniref:NFACT RNA binding domain-containing protein n=1 Tax=Larkinella sp. VNQ87 TaxID=3400921 RepID=UPI003BFC601B
MHTNFYFLRQLAPALEPQLTGLKFMECFSQDRDELVLVFAQARGKVNFYRPFFIKATLRPDFSGLLFPETVQRARQNSVDLFEEWYDRDVLAVRSFLNERCLGITLNGGVTLLFKFFGNRPNLLIFSEDTVTDLFNNRLVSDAQLRLSALDRPLDQSWEAYEQSGFDHRKLYPTFGKLVNAYLDDHGLREKTAPEQWALIQETVWQLEKPPFYLTTFQHKPTLSLLPYGEIRQEFTDPIAASNRFYSAFMGQNTLEREKGEALRLLEKRLKRTQAAIDMNLQRLIGLDEAVKNEEIANILMANLHQIPEKPVSRSPEVVELEDFYRNTPIKIKLKTELSPQKNAEHYYRKSKNEKIETTLLQQQLENREAEIRQLQQQLDAIQPIESLRELRKYLKNNPIGEEKAADGTAPLFKQVIYEGFVILIGRNAKNNDLLTQQYAYKDDLWLHARDVPGSHVIIKYKAGKPFPKTVIERAAELAAWYSKRRTDSLCPVIVTPKKFVRKPKGLAAGQVKVEKEDVILVEPRDEGAQRA